MKRVFLVLMIISLAPALLVGCGSGLGTDQSSGEDDEAEKEKSSVSVVTVDAHSVSVREVQETIEEVGTLKAAERTMVTSEIAGTVEGVHFKEGEVVNKEGDGSSAWPLLVTLDDDLLQAELETHRARLNTRQTERRQAQDGLTRQRKMRENKATTEAEFTKAKISVERAEAKIAEVKARIDQIQEELVRTKIRAPFSGLLGERMVSPGTYIKPGDPIVEVVQLDPIEVRFTVPEKFKQRLSVGQNVKVQVSAFPDQSFEGNVFFVSSTSKVDTRTIPVKARIDNPEHKLGPGMYARVRLVTDVRSNAPVIPDTAVVPRNDTQYVYVVEDGKAVRREVQLGERMDGSVEIRSGLDGSETVIVAGLQKVNDGVTVDVR